MKIDDRDKLSFNTIDKKGIELINCCILEQNTCHQIIITNYTTANCQSLPLLLDAPNTIGSPRAML